MYMRSRANWEKGKYETSGIRISGFGEVFKALDTISHDLVAIKKVKLLSDDKRIEKESELLKECQSRAIPQCVANGKRVVGAYGLTE